jgi:hypothetical protein
MCALPAEEEIITRKEVMLKAVAPVELLSSGIRERNWDRRRKRSLNRASWKNWKKVLPSFSHAD